MKRLEYLASRGDLDAFEALRREQYRRSAFLMPCADAESWGGALAGDGDCYGYGYGYGDGYGYGSGSGDGYGSDSG